MLTVQKFQKKLDRLAMDALRAEMDEETVQGFYDGMLENFQDDPANTIYEFLQLKGNVDLILKNKEVIAA